MTGEPLLPVDPVLPQLALALNEGRMAGVFSDAVHGQGLAVHGCRVDRVKYRPRRTCTLSYLLKVSAGGGCVTEQRVSARLCSGGDSSRRMAKAAGVHWHPTLSGPTLLHLPSLDMLTWWWPNDSKLTAPRVLADDELLGTRVLPAVIAALSGSPCELVRHDVTVVQYVPESRLTARVHLQWRAQGRLHSQRVYAKASREPDGAVAHAMLHDLQKSEAWLAGSLSTPRALLWQPEFGLHWQTEMPGTPLLDLGPQAFARLGARLGERLGAQLAALHAVPVSQARPVGQRGQRLTEVVQLLELALAQPELTARLQRLAEHLAAGLHWLRGQPLATLHGDLHPRNVLVDTQNDHHLSLIDLDGMRQGPALLEIGALLAEGMYRAVLDGVAPNRDAVYWRALLNAHAMASGNRMHPRALAWSAAWSLLTERAWRCVVNLKPGRLAIVPQLIAHAERLVDDGGPELVS